MATPVTMPQLGETVVEGTITKWLKQEGETVERDEPLFEISTDKVDTEVPSPLAGTIVQIKVQEGETVSVGTELAMIDAGGNGQAGATQEAPAQEAPAQEAPAQEAPAQVDGQAAPGDGQRAAAAEPAASPQAREAEQQDEQAGAGEEDRPAQPAQAQVQPPPERPRAQAQEQQPGEEVPSGGERSQILSPLVRRLAEENQIDLSQVRGTGTGGRITKKDIQGYLDSRGQEPQPQPVPQPEPAPQPQPVPQPQPEPRPQPTPPEPVPQPQMAAQATAAVGPREEAIPLTRMRQAIAKHMVTSIQTSARAWNLVEVNMENVAQTRLAAKDGFKEREGISLTYMPFVARAVCEALMAFPDVNSELREDELIRKHYVNLGIAVALDDGLIVPVIKGADTMNIIGLARAVQDMATRARTKKLTPDDVHGSTFTITNPGPFGSIISVAIINQPNCAILAFDAVEKRPVVVDDAIAIRHMVYLSMSWDHRIIDGATAAKFLARLKQNLETWDFGPEVGLPARGS